MRRYFLIDGVVYSLTDYMFNKFQKRLRLIKTEVSKADQPRELKCFREELTSTAKCHFYIDAEFHI